MHPLPYYFINFLALGAKFKFGVNSAYKCAHMNSNRS